MIERFARFSYAISEISRCWHKIAGEEMARYGLSGPHCVYLLTLYRHPEGVTSTRLAELCGKDKADVSRTVSILLNKGFISRTGASYRALLQLTEEGKQAAIEVQQRAATAVEMGGKGLTDQNREIFYDTLDQIAANLSNICQEGLPHGNSPA